MSKWIGVVQHDFDTGERLGETLINLDNATVIKVTENVIEFNSGSAIKINNGSMETLIEYIDYM